MWEGHKSDIFNGSRNVNMIINSMNVQDQDIMLPILSSNFVSFSLDVAMMLIHFFSMPMCTNIYDLAYIILYIIDKTQSV